METTGLEKKTPVPDIGSMRLGSIEFMLMNNPFRRYIQKRIEFETFTHFLVTRGINLKGKIIMDAGCGSGFSTELIFKRFAPAHLIAFDLMPEQVALARKRNIQVDFFIGDVTDIQKCHRGCDAVFVFGIVHHIPGWQKALDEIAGALKSGGYLLIEEPGVRYIRWPLLEQGMERAGLTILEQQDILFGRLRSYLCRKE
jgi:SAM-dependent methyltransferase